MKSKLLETNGDGGRIFILVFDEGDEAVSGTKAFAAENGITGASVSAIGALSAGTVAWLNWDTKQYEPTAVDQQCEVVSMLGDIGIDEAGKPALHLHGALAVKGGTTFGGHVQSAHVRPTLEVTITETPSHFVRTKRPELGGMLLIDLDRS